MAGLVVTDTLLISGSDGVHEIQLCFGDITELPVKDKVDVVMVSAFPGTIMSPFCIFLSFCKSMDFRIFLVKGTTLLWRELSLVPWKES